MCYRVLSFIPFMKKNLQKSGLSSLGETVKFMSDVNTDYTRSSMRLTMYLMTFFLGAGTVGVLNALKLLFIKVEIDSDVKSLVMLLELFLLALPMGFYFVWGKDKYVAYFKGWRRNRNEKQESGVLSQLCYMLRFYYSFSGHFVGFNITLNPTTSTVHSLKRHLCGRCCRCLCKFGYCRSDAIGMMTPLSQ